MAKSGTTRRHLRRAIKDLGNWCYYCAQDSHGTRLTLDHLIPLSRGGSYGLRANHAPACYRCNQDKGDLTVEEYIEQMGYDPRWFPRLGAYSNGKEGPDDFKV